jgi:hypothetical protein
MSGRDTVEEASRVVLSYSPTDDDDIAEGIAASSFRAYLRKAHDGPVQLGDEWAEFVNCGCGSTKDVTLRVQSLTDGDAIGENTDIEYEPAG